MGRTTIEVSTNVRDELRSYKADHGLTYDTALLRLLSESGWTFRHHRLDPDQNGAETNGNKKTTS